MNSEDVQEHRRARLNAAVEKAGGKAALGRLLGYRDGSFVGQMLRGERHIKEDTVRNLETKPGFRGWFGEQAQPVHGPLTPLEADLLAAFRSIPDEEQNDLVERTMAQAERYNNLVKRELERRGLPITGFVSPARAAQTLPPAPKTKKPRGVRSDHTETAKKMESPTSKKLASRRTG